MERERRGEKPAVRGRAGAANGERGRRRARQGGGGGALFQGRASAALSGGAERTARHQRDQAGCRVARGGAQAAEGARRADGLRRELLARGCRSRGTPRPQRLLLQDEPRGHRPCPRSALAQRCSPGACADSPA